MTNKHLAANAPTIGAGLEHDIITALCKADSKDELIRILTKVEALADGPEKVRLSDSARQAISLKERLEQLQTRERGLMALIDTAQNLTAIRDIDQVLQAIVNRARSLIACDIGYLSIYDYERGDFYVRATDGAFSEKFKQIRVARDVGICGFVARNRSPYCSSDYEFDSRFAHTNLIDSAVTDEDIKSILGVPLLSGSQVIGVLFVGDRYARAYNAWEMSILSTLAAHASVAIENARLFAQTQAALKQASEANARLEKQTADTQNAAEAHEKLTTLVARGGGIKELCDMVARMLGGQVACLDEGEQIIYAAGAGGHATTASEKYEANQAYSKQDKIHAALGESRVLGKSVTAFVTEQGVCRVSAVIGGRGLLGGLVIYTAQELDDVSIRIFERSSVVTGVVLLSQEKSETAIKNEVPLVLRNLLSQPQRDPDKLERQIARYGLDPARSTCILLLSLAGGGLGDPGYLVNRLRKLPPLANTLLDQLDGAVVLIGPGTAADAIRKAVLGFFTDNAREKIAGILSRPVERLTDLPATYASLCRCLAMLPLLGRTGAIFDEAELSLYSVLFREKSADEVEAFLSSMLHGLAARDDPRKIDLAKTLLCYLDHGHNARAAAHALGIHINTFRQRLEVINGLLGDWTAPSRSLEIHIALRFWQLQNRDAGAL